MPTKQPADRARETDDGNTDDRAQECDDVCGQPTDSRNDDGRRKHTSPKCQSRDGDAQNHPLASAIHCIPGLVWTASPDGLVDFVNDPWCQYTGLSNDALLCGAWSALVHGDDLAGFETYRHATILQGTSGETEARLRRFDGAYRWFLFRIIPVHDRKGALVKWYGHATDIDRLKQTEDRLRASEALLREVQCFSSTGSVGWNATTGAGVWSAKTFSILRYDPSVAPTLDQLLQRVHPEDREYARQRLNRAESGGEFELRLKMPDSSVKHVRLVTRVAQRPTEICQYVAAITELTKRERTADPLYIARGALEMAASTLTVLSRDSKPEALLEYALRGLCEQLDGVSAGVWEKKLGTGAILLANYDGRLHLATPETLVITVKEGPPLEEDHPWSAFFRGEITLVYGRLGEGLIEVAKHFDGPWFGDAQLGASAPLNRKLTAGHLARGAATTLNLPMVVGGRVTGLFVVRSRTSRELRPVEREFAQVIAHQATLAVQLMRLTQQNREAAVVAERVRMARDIHDTLAQGFMGVILQLEAAKGALEKDQTDEAARRIGRASELSRGSLREARRSMRALRPGSFDGKTLEGAIKQLLLQMTDGATLKPIFTWAGKDRTLPTGWEDNILRIIQEALTNTLKHSNARTFRVRVEYLAEEVAVQLADDGQGFGVHTEHQGFGLMGMRERVSLMGGKFLITSAPGIGTEIEFSAEIPAASND
jgi:PAS domain S-box-containing protein